MTRLEFSAKTKKAAWDRAAGNCEFCLLPFLGTRAEYHHIIEAELKEDNSLENCLCVHVGCHKYLTKTQSSPRLAKIRRILRKAAGIKPKRQVMQGSRASRWKKKIDGTVERRS